MKVPEEHTIDELLEMPAEVFREMDAKRFQSITGQILVNTVRNVRDLKKGVGDLKDEVHSLAAPKISRRDWVKIVIVTIPPAIAGAVTLAVTVVH